MVLLKTPKYLQNRKSDQNTLQNDHNNPKNNQNKPEASKMTKLHVITPRMTKIPIKSQNYQVH